MYCETDKDPFFKPGLLISSQKTTESSISEFCWLEEVKDYFFFLLFFLESASAYLLRRASKKKRKAKILIQLPDRGLPNFLF